MFPLAPQLGEVSVLISKLSFAQYFASCLGLCGFFRTDTLGLYSGTLGNNVGV